jgi:hypothetical protein
MHPGPKRPALVLTHLWAAMASSGFLAAPGRGLDRAQDLPHGGGVPLATLGGRHVVGGQLVQDRVRDEARVGKGQDGDRPREAQHDAGLPVDLAPGQLGAVVVGGRGRAGQAADRVVGCHQIVVRRPTELRDRLARVRIVHATRDYVLGQTTDPASTAALQHPLPAAHGLDHVDRGHVP